MTYWPDDQIVHPNPAALRDEDEAAWLDLRRQGIGGSEAAAVCRVPTYLTPYQVWLDKTGTYRPEFTGNEAIYWGNVLEPILAHHFSKEHPELRVEYDGLPMLRSRVYPWMQTNLDAVLIDADDRLGVLEIKTTGVWLEDEWEGDDAPLAATFQVLHNAIVAGAEFAWVCCLIGGQKFVSRHVPIDGEVVDEIIDREHRFWHENVLGGVIPELVARDYDTVRERWPEDDGSRVDLPDEARKWIAEYVRLGVEEKRASEGRQAVANELRAAIGDGKVGFLDGEPVISWASGARGRSLRVLKAGKGLA